MLSYYVEHPRGFANEYAVYATDSPAAFADLFPDATRVGRREAIRLGWSRPKEAGKDGEQWFGGFYQDGRGRYPDDLAAAVRECHEATSRLIDSRHDAIFASLAGGAGR